MKLLHNILGIVCLILLLFCTWMSGHFFLCHYKANDIADGCGSDPVSIFIGFVAALITLLVGWQIFTTIEDRQRVAKMDKIVADLKSNEIKELEKSNLNLKNQIDKLTKTLQTIPCFIEKSNYASNWLMRPNQENGAYLALMAASESLVYASLMEDMELYDKSDILVNAIITNLDDKSLDSYQIKEIEMCIKNVRPFDEKVKFDAIETIARLNKLHNNK